MLCALGQLVGGAIQITVVIVIVIVKMFVSRFVDYFAYETLYMKIPSYNLSVKRL